MNQPKPINPYDFQDAINRYAQDIVILFDSTIERYRIYQIFEPIQGFVMHDYNELEARRSNLRLLFTIQEQNGDYRDPDENDLARIVESVSNTIDLSVRGFDNVVDDMERADIAREESLAPGVKDTMEWGAKEMYKIRTRKGIMGFN